ncbi:MAG: hypothetical protein U0872_01695 [Planctomycetaceae bacterium]
MSSFRFSLWMLTACGLLSGCVVTPDGKVALKIFYKDPAQTEKLADQEKAGDKKEDKASAVAAKEKADNPFRKKEGDAGKAAVAETSAKKPDSDAQIATASAESAKTAESPGKDSSAKNGVLSVDTLKLIDEELADATPEERADWYEQLKRVDPAVIPQILQARKMSLQVASMRQADTASDREFDEVDAARDSSIAKSTEPRSQRSHNARKTASFDRSGEIEPTGYQEYGNDRHEADHRDSAVAQASEPAPARNRWLSPGKQPPAGRNDNGQYVVQRVSGETQSPESAVGTAGGAAATTPRQGLARFLPRSVSGNSAQLTANSPSAVSLMPPTDIHPASSQDGLDQLISEIEADIVNWQPGIRRKSRSCTFSGTFI